MDCFLFLLFLLYSLVVVVYLDFERLKTRFRFCSLFFQYVSIRFEFCIVDLLVLT